MKRRAIVFAVALVVALSAGRSVAKAAQESTARIAFQLDRHRRQNSARRARAAGACQWRWATRHGDSRRPHLLPRSCRRTGRDEGTWSHREARSGLQNRENARHARWRLHALAPHPSAVRHVSDVRRQQVAYLRACQISLRKCGAPGRTIPQVTNVACSGSRDPAGQGSNRAIHRSRKERPAEGLGLVKIRLYHPQDLRKGTVYRRSSCSSR